MRTVIRIRWAFAYYTPRAVACRGTPDQIALAEWLFHELDQPGGQERVAQPHEYRLSASEEDAVRVFYLPHSETVEHFQEFALYVRRRTGSRELFIYNARRALVLRGTAAELALADRLVRERDR